MKSTWRAKENYPNLLGKAKEISFDVETYDPNLEDRGPGALRKDGYICGFSVATDDGFSGYYPIRHEGGDNLPDIGKTVRWLRDMLSDNTPKIGANLLYDLVWLHCDLDIQAKGKMYDVQIAEPLLDENKWTYTLESLAVQYLGEHKEEMMLYEAGVILLKLKQKKQTKDESVDILQTMEEARKDVIKQVKGLLYKLPARYVGEYGEADAVLPIKIFAKQKVLLKEKGLWDLFDNVETEILDLLLKMWIKGIPVDMDKGVLAMKKMEEQYKAVLKKIKSITSQEIDVWSAPECEKACIKLGLKYPLTDKDNPSFTADWLHEQEHDFFKLLLQARQLDRSGSVFVKSKILDLAVNGRIRPQFWQVKSERYGTVSGRFSSSNPNAQQFPSKNEEVARLVRGIFVAEKGCEWGIFDWSQQEPRLSVHYASLLKLTGAEEARQKYIQNPATDYHQMVADMTGLIRSTAKQVNLGMSYGMGITKFSEKYGFTYSAAKDIFNQYHEGLPFIRELTKKCELAVKNKKFIKTLLGRHCNFDLYGPYKWEKGQVPKRYDEAVKEFGTGVTQYFTYRAMNRLIQGSAADMIKKAMVDCYRAGYVPCLTVHDELDFCDITGEKMVKEISDIMLNCVKLQVPLKLDIERGPNWGECEETF